MRVMLLHKLAEHIPEDYVPPQKLIADVGKMVSDARHAGLLRMTGGPAPNLPTASELPLLGSNRQAEPQTKARGSLLGHCPSWARTRPQGPLEPVECQQLAAIYASSCHRMLRFEPQNARLCRPLLAQSQSLQEPPSPSSSWQVGTEACTLAEAPRGGSIASVVPTAGGRVDCVADSGDLPCKLIPWPGCRPRSPKPLATATLFGA
jgi:hypothetical protein